MSTELRYDSEDGCYVWEKGQNLPLSLHFRTSEFACPCLNQECTRQIISASLVQKLESMRNELGFPIGINSGYRCGYYQRELAARGYETAKGISQHQLGKAADIRAHDIFALKAAAETRFKAIGTSHLFLHVDERSDKVRRWGYSS